MKDSIKICCPHCGKRKNKVVAKSYVGKDRVHQDENMLIHIRRAYTCLHCGRQFLTMEETYTPVIGNKYGNSYMNGEETEQSIIQDMLDNNSNI